MITQGVETDEQPPTATSSCWPSSTNSTRSSGTAGTPHDGQETILTNHVNIKWCESLRNKNNCVNAEKMKRKNRTTIRMDDGNGVLEGVDVGYVIGRGEIEDFSER